MKKCFWENRSRKFRYWLFAAGILLLLTYWACEASGEEGNTDLNLYAGGAVLMDGYTGRILYEKNASQVLPMASTTKIMTCITALENSDPEELVEVSSYAASMPDVQLGMNQGEKYRLGDLLLSLMLESHNDTAVAVAEHIGAKIVRSAENGSQVTEAAQRSVMESKELVAAFADLMNQKAAEIGCRNTYFITPNGLDAAEEAEDENGEIIEKTHSTTAADLALIMRYCLSGSKKAEEFIQITQTREVSFADYDRKRSFSCINHNRYLDMKEGAVSGKTGFTGKAGYCYVGAVNQNGVFLIVSLLACGWPPAKNLKWQDMNTLVNYGLENYRCIQVNSLQNADSSYLIDDIPGKGVELVKVKTGVSFEPFSLLVKEGEHVSGSWYLELKTAETGDTVGEYRVTVGDTICRTFPVVICEEEVWNAR
ncbi:MAG: D-alanyl-D-alanine carboxypeptidase family protein [Lachnospiraceae bacterium]